MNSKQLNFFIVPEDLVPIYEFFDKNEIKSVDKIVQDVENLILNKIALNHGNVYERIYLTNEEFKSNLRFSYDEKKQGFSLNSDKSYILEFDPGGFYPASCTVLNRGRFYCSMSYFVSNNEVVRKDDEFKSWVDKTFRRFKKEFLIQYGANKHILFSTRAIEWMKTNNGQVDAAFLKIMI
jgi:hypothetical protein